MEEEHQQAFGEHTGIDGEVRGCINLIKDNDPDFTRFILDPSDADRFTDLAWTLLGRYIANNTHLKEINLENCRLTDEKMASLFRELTRIISLERLDIDDNEFGIEGVRSMISFLQNSPNLSVLYLGGNRNIKSECFELLISALEESLRKNYSLVIAILQTYQH